MDLRDRTRERRAARGDRGLLERSGCEDDIARLPTPAVGLEREAVAVVRFPAERSRGDAQPQGRADVDCVFLEELHDMVAMSEAVWIIGTVGIAGQRQRPVRKLEGQRIPPFAAPAL